MSNPQRKMESSVMQTISPVDGSVYCERPYNTGAEIDAALAKAVKAQRGWAEMKLVDRQKIILKALDFMLSKAPEIATELTWQMGRPVGQTLGEINRGFAERTKY